MRTCTGYFRDSILLFDKVRLDCDFPIFHLGHWYDKNLTLQPAIGQHRVSQTLCLGWPWTAICLISASQEARILVLAVYQSSPEPSWQARKKKSLRNFILSAVIQFTPHRDLWNMAYLCCCIMYQMVRSVVLLDSLLCIFKKCASLWEMALGLWETFGLSPFFKTYEQRKWRSWYV
jgi:hypothetical protein